MTLLLTIVAFLVMVCVLVAAHEYGHFLFARMFKMDVEEFAIGFGKGKWTWMRRNGTDFTLRPIPLGGFVRTKGMVPEENGSEIKVEGGFYSKPPWQRWLMLFAGPLFSILFGVILLVGLYSTVGRMQPVNRATIGVVVKDGAADKAGIKVGDKILSIDGQPTVTFFDILSKVREKPEIPIQIVYEREGKQATVTVTPKKDPSPTPVFSSDLELTDTLKIQGKLGILWDVERIPLPLGAAIAEGLKAPVQTLTSLAGLITQPSKAKEEVGGPIRIASITNDAVQQGFSTVLFLAAMLSISLGFMNLIPIPPFDGGQMVVAFVEMLRRGKRLSFRVQELVSTVGFVVIVAMVVGIFYIDLTRKSGNEPTKAEPAATQDTKK